MVADRYLPRASRDDAPAARTVLARADRPLRGLASRARHLGQGPALLQDAPIVAHRLDGALRRRPPNTLRPPAGLLGLLGVVINITKYLKLVRARPDDLLKSTQEVDDGRRRVFCDY